jgi:hypothetical protein
MAEERRQNNRGQPLDSNDRARNPPPQRKKVLVARKIRFALAMLHLVAADA